MIDEQTTISIRNEPITVVNKNKKTSFGGDVLRLVSGATVAQGLGILLAPVLSRLFAPEAFGTADVFVSIVSVIGVVVCLRYELAIMLPENNEEAANLLAGTLILAGLITAVSALATRLLRDPIVRLLKAPDLAYFLWLLPVVVSVTGVSLALTYWNSRGKYFGRLSVARVTASASTGITKLGMGSLGYRGPGGLIGGYVMGPIISAVILGWQTWRDDKRVIQRVRWPGIIEELNRYRRFPLLSTWSALLNVLSRQLPIFVLSIFFSQEIVGYYGQGTRLIQVPLALIGSAVAQVLFQRASEARREGTLGVVVANVYQRLVILGLFPMLALTLIGQEVFVIVLGSKWAEAGAYAQIMGPWRFLVFVGSPMSILPSVLERQDVDLTFNIILFISRAVSLVLGSLLGNARIALALYAGSGLLMWGGFVIWVLWVTGTSMRQAVVGLMRCLLYALPILVCVSIVKWWWDWSALAIVAVAAVGTLLYYGIVIWQDSTLRAMSINALKRVGVWR